METEKHWVDFEETFNRIRKSRIKLKPEKCTFGVLEGKFVGSLISYEGIKPHPEKVKAITNMKPPKTLKELQKLNGKTAALGRFIRRSADKCRPFFKILKNPSKNIEWSEECINAFEELKEVLKKLPTLQPPSPNQLLYLYVAGSDTSISAILVTDNNKTQNPVFYFSKTLQGVECRYPPLEKLALAVISSARRLRAYFQAHPIIIPTNHALLQTLHNPDLFGRLAKCAIELRRYDIKFIPAKAIKAQALAYFIAELTLNPAHTKTIPEILEAQVNGSARKNGCGTGVILKNTEGLRLEKTIHFNFQITNNAAEYEAFLADLDLAKELKIKNLVVNTDSLLVDNQVHAKHI